MSSVMILCPRTGRVVSTAIEVESTVFRTLPKIAARMYCSACGEEHIWSTGAAWLSDEPHVVEKVSKTIEAA